MFEPVQDEHLLQRNASPVGVAPALAERVAARKPVQIPGTKLAAHHSGPVVAGLSFTASAAALGTVIVARPSTEAALPPPPIRRTSVARHGSPVTRFEQAVRPSDPEAQENYDRGR